MTRQVTVGDTVFTLSASGHDGRWEAEARSEPDQRRFGPVFEGDREDDALDRLAAWLEWQHEHHASLDALQQIEKVYHRTMAGSAFATGTDGPTPFEMQRDALERLEAARLRLDEVRARRPDR